MGKMPVKKKGYAARYVRYQLGKNRMFSLKPSRSSQSNVGKRRRAANRNAVIVLPSRRATQRSSILAVAWANGRKSLELSQTSKEMLPVRNEPQIC